MYLINIEPINVHNYHIIIICCCCWNYTTLYHNGTVSIPVLIELYLYCLICVLDITVGVVFLQ